MEASGFQNIVKNTCPTVGHAILAEFWLLEAPLGANRRRLGWGHMEAPGPHWTVLLSGTCSLVGVTMTRYGGEGGMDRSVAILATGPDRSRCGSLRLIFLRPPTQWRDSGHSSCPPSQRHGRKGWGGGSCAPIVESATPPSSGRARKRARLCRSHTRIRPGRSRCACGLALLWRFRMGGDHWLGGAPYGGVERAQMCDRTDVWRKQSVSM